MNRGKASSSKVSTTLAGASIGEIFSSFGSAPSLGDSSGTNAEVLNCFKLLDKKEPVTRSRALQEFLLKVLPGLSAQEQRSAVPEFFRVYKKGALLDPDWKCRSLYHNSLGEICRVLGKSIEPYLAEIASTWLIALFDASNRDVALNASRSFEAAFPGAERKKKVFIHFSSELFEHICSILSSDVTSLARPFNKGSSEEMLFESKETWERLTFASLRCARYLCDIHNPAKVAAVLDPLRYLWSGPSCTAAVLDASVELALYLAENTEAEIFSTFLRESKLQSVVLNLGANLSVEESSKWRLLAFLLPLSPSLGPKVVRKMENIISESEIRLFSPAIFESLISLSVSAKTYFGKLKEGIALDSRIRRKYASVLSGLAKCFVSACVANTDGSYELLAELLKLARDCSDVRRATLECIVVDLNTCLREKIRVNFLSILEKDEDLVGPSISAILTDTPLTSLPLSLLKDVREVGVLLSFGKHVDVFAKELPAVAEIWLNDPNDRETALELIRTILEKYPQVCSALMPKLSFIDRVDLSLFSAPPVHISVIDFIKNLPLQKAFLTAMEMDEGIIFLRFEIIREILQSKDLHDFKKSVISQLLMKPTESDSLLLEAWIQYCDDNSLISTSSSEIFLSIFTHNSCLRKDAAEIFFNHILVDGKSVVKLMETMEALFPTDRDELLGRIIIQDIWSENIVRMDVDFFQNSDLYPVFLAELSRFHDTALNPLSAENNSVKWIRKIHFHLSKNKPFTQRPFYDSLLKSVSESNDLKAFMIDLAQDPSWWNLFVLHNLGSLTCVAEEVCDLLEQYLTSNRKSSVEKNAILAILSISDYRNISTTPELLPLDDPLVLSHISESPGSEHRIKEWIESCFCISAKNTFAPLTYINSKAVCCFLISQSDYTFGEEAYFRYRSLKNLSVELINPEFIGWLSQEGSLEWAVDALDLRKECVVARLMQFSIPNLLKNKAVIARLLDHDSVEHKITVWTVILTQFLTLFPRDTLFMEYFEEDISEMLFSVTVDCISAYLKNDDDERVLKKSAEKLLSMILRSVSPGNFHEWFSSSTRSVNVSLAEQLFVQKGISHSFIADQVSRDKEVFLQKDNLRVSYSGSCRMLSCSYSSHGGEIEANLKVTFPDCWPLRLAYVDVSPVVGLNKAKNSRLQVSIQSVFKLNGVQRGIRIWVENIEGFLADVEECYICYSVTYHGSSTVGGSIPSKQCRTCKNKFHSECLLKYFRTSGKTICCLCQNPF